MTQSIYEADIEQLIADLRLDVAPDLDANRPANESKFLSETVHNAADFMQHQLTVLRMMRSILTEAGGGEDGRAKQLLRALDKVIAAAPTQRTQQADIQHDFDTGKLA